MNKIDSIEKLEVIYGAPKKPSVIKETNIIIPQYASFIEASPFCTIATMGDKRDGGMMDCTPRGDIQSVVRVQDKTTLLLPDWHGNNRIDTLRNIVNDPRIAMCFLVPGSVNCLRVNGEAFITDDEALKSSFEVSGKHPRSVIVIKTKSVYFQCGRAIIRSKLWEEATKVDPKTLPTAGEVLAYISENDLGGAEYDANWAQRANSTLW